MYRLARSAFAKQNVRRVVAASALSLTGVGLTTSVAFAKAPQSEKAETPLKVEVAEVSTGVPKLTPRDLSEVTPVEVEEPQKERRAYDPETGEIDWDCPCLGGMAHGPCGEEFKEAFSCFVYSKEEIKGSECIPKFSAMQNCFRKYPEVYADFQGDDDAPEPEPSGSAGQTSAAAGAARDAAETTKKSAKEVSNKTTEGVAAGSQLAKEASTGAKDATQGLVESGKAAGQQATDKAKETADSVTKAAQTKLEEAKPAAARVADGSSQLLKDAEVASATAVDSVRDTAASTADAVRTELSGVKEDLSNQASPAASSPGLEEKIQSLKDKIGGISGGLIDKTAAAIEELESELKSDPPLSAQLTGEAKRDIAQLEQDGLNLISDLKKTSGSSLIDQATDALHQSETFISDAVAGVTAEAQDAIKAVGDKFK